MLGIERLLGKDMLEYNGDEIETRSTKRELNDKYEKDVSTLNKNCVCRLKPMQEWDLHKIVNFVIYCNHLFDMLLQDMTKPLKHSFKCLGVIQEFSNFLNTDFFEKHKEDVFNYDEEDFSYQTLKDAILFVVEKVKKVLQTCADFNYLKANWSRMNFGFNQELFTGTIKFSGDNTIIEQI